MNIEQFNKEAQNITEQMANVSSAKRKADFVITEYYKRYNIEVTHYGEACSISEEFLDKTIIDDLHIFSDIEKTVLYKYVDNYKNIIKDELNLLQQLSDIRHAYYGENKND